ncbi:MAG: DNA polymerase Y family protein [Pseudonocardiaceae bacterium]
MRSARLGLPRRVVAVWCPDWPARRQASGRRPGLADDLDRDGRAFESVVAAVEALAPGVEVVRPGLVAVPAHGPTRYFGSEPVVAERIAEAVIAQAGARCQIGIADGLFTATLAAYRGLRVPPGGSAAFLAPLSIGELHQPAVDRAGAGRTGVEGTGLVDLLHRLGLRTLGAFAALDSGDVASRFGPEGIRAHRLARGLDERPLARRRPPIDLAVTRRFDPPVDRIDAAAFASREPAEQLHAALASRGLACLRLGVSARTEAGEQLHRVWRCAEPLTAAGIADRVRWQLDGWLTSRAFPSGADDPARQADSGAGITQLHLTPEEVIGGQALQGGLWGEATKDDERAGRALVRVQGMLGPDAVLTGVLSGGRGPAEQVRLVPWGDDPTPARRIADPLASSSSATADPLGGTGPPWPGRLPAPSPSRVPPHPLPAEVLDDAARVIGVSERGVLTGIPHRVAVDGHPPRRVLAWAGPWPIEQRWWDPGAGRHSAWLQAVLDAEPGPGRVSEPLAVLLGCAQGRWQVEGIYE